MDAQLKKYLDFYQSVDQFGKDNHYELTVTAPGEIEYKMKVLDKHQSSPGHAHGGAIAGLMDSTLGVAALSHAMSLQCLCSTVEFKINFIAPAVLGSTLRGVGKIDHKGKSLVITSAEIFDENGKLIAKGMGTFNLYPMDKKDFMKGMIG